MGYEEQKNGIGKGVPQRRRAEGGSRGRLRLPFPLLETTLTLITVFAAILVVANFGTITAAIAIFIANMLTSMIFPVICILILVCLFFYWRNRRWRRRW